MNVYGTQDCPDELQTHKCFASVGDYYHSWQSKLWRMKSPWTIFLGTSIRNTSIKSRLQFSRFVREPLTGFIFKFHWHCFSIERKIRLKMKKIENVDNLLINWIIFQFHQWSIVVFQSVDIWIVDTRKRTIWLFLISSSAKICFDVAYDNNKLIFNPNSTSP